MYGTSIGTIIFIYIYIYIYTLYIYIILYAFWCTTGILMQLYTIIGIYWFEKILLKQVLQFGFSFSANVSCLEIRKLKTGKWETKKVFLPLVIWGEWQESCPISRFLFLKRKILNMRNSWNDTFIILKSSDIFFLTLKYFYLFQVIFFVWILLK